MRAELKRAESNKMLSKLNQVWARRTPMLTKEKPARETHTLSGLFRSKSHEEVKFEDGGQRSSERRGASISYNASIAGGGSGTQQELKQTIPGLCLP